MITFIHDVVDACAVPGIKAVVMLQCERRA
jgi:hypothetical protein